MNNQTMSQESIDAAMASAEKPPSAKPRLVQLMPGQLVLRKFADPILSEKCIAVNPMHPDTRALAKLLKRAVVKFHGAGLAAPQIGFARRMIVIRPGGSGESVVMVNPEIIDHSPDQVSGSEMCLSYPDVLVRDVKRWRWVKVRCICPKTADMYVTTRYDFAARVIQHEIDHLDGVCVCGDEWRRKQTSKQAAEVQAAEIIN